MTVKWYRILGCGFLGLLAFGACGDGSKKLTAGETCLLNTDCNSPLVCTMGTCHAGCRETRDCPAGQSCVQTSTAAVCQLPAEADCRATVCRGDLVCAVDYRCRKACQTVAECTSGQLCVTSVCADATDLDTSGQLPQRNPAWSSGVDAGVPDATAALDSAVKADAPDAPVDVPITPVDAPALDLPPADLPSLDVGSVGPACSGTCDDGLLCTTDSCVSGSCQGTLNPGYCVIDKTCHRDGDTKPGDACQACIPSSSTTLWTPVPEGAPCGTAKSCQSQVCSACGAVGQACCGSSKPGICAVGAVCNNGTNRCEADKAIDISGSNQTFCVLFKSGRVRCWGPSGPLLGATTGSNAPAPPVPGVEDAVDIAVGEGAACAVRAAGSVVCWGNVLPGSGNSTTVPLVVPGISNAKEVSIGLGHACVRTSDGKLVCWGDNTYGQRGDSASVTSPTVPAAVPNGTDVRSIAACGYATCVLHTGGQVSCTGAGYENGQSTDTAALTDLASVTNADTLSCSTNNSTRGTFCAVTQLGPPICWGGNYQSPAAVLGLGQPQTVLWTGASYYALQTDRSLWALGFNSVGELGDGTFMNATSHTSPKLIHASSPVSNVVAMAAYIIGGTYRQSTCFLRDDGSVSCAGGDTLGDGQQPPPAPRAYLVPVVGILPVASEDGQCFDGVDNDGDGKSDLDDSDCAQDLGSLVGNSVVAIPFAGIFGNYLKESCNDLATSNFGGPDAVFVWTAPTSGAYRFDTTGSSFDTVLAAFKGNPTTSAELGCNDDGADLASGASSLQLEVIASDKLTIVVDSKSNPAAADALNLSITEL